MKKAFLFIAILLTVTFIGCSDKDDNKDIEMIKVTATSESFNSLIEGALKNLTQTKDYKGLKSSDKISFTSKNGVKLIIYVSDLLDENNNPVTGDISLKFIEIYDNSNMVVANKPTVGKTYDNKLNGLFSGGEFYIELTQNNKKLKLKYGSYYSLEVSASLTEDEKPEEMIIWIGNINEAGNLVWEQNPPLVDGEIEIGGGVEFAEGTYYSFLSVFGWANIDRFWNYKGEKTKIKVTVPKGYDNKNSVVYFTVKGESNSLAQLDVYKDGYFSEHYGFIPVGIDANIIFVSESNKKWAYAIKTLNTQADQIIEITNEDLKIATEEELIQKIKDLP